MKNFDRINSRLTISFFSLQKVLLFKLHFLKFVPRLLSKLSPPVTKFEATRSSRSKLVLPGAHWHNDADTETSSQETRGTRQFIASVNGGLYETGLYELLRLPFSRVSRSTPYDLSERINYCFILFIGQDKNFSNEERCLIQEMANYVLGNLEYYGGRWTNNHYLNNARALLSASILLNDHKLAGRALSILKHAIKINFPNGVFQERSSSYHCLIVYWLKSIYLYLDLIEGTVALKQTVRDLLAKNEIRGLQLLNFGDNTPDFSKCNIQCLTTFFDQFLPTREISAESEWISGLNSGNFEFSIVTGEHQRFGPEHGYRNLGCFHLTFKGRPIFLSTARPSYNNAATKLGNEPGSLSSGHILVGGRSIYGQKPDLPVFNYCSDPKELPFVSEISKDREDSNFSLLINSMHGLIREKFYLHADEFFIELSHQDGKAITLSFLIPKEFSFVNGFLDSKNLKLSVITSENLVKLNNETCLYSDEYGVSKKGWRLIALFGPTKPGEASFIKFKEK